MKPIDLLYAWLAFLALPIIVFLSYVSWQLILGAAEGIKDRFSR